MSDWQTLSTKVAYENPFMYMQEDQAINPAGRQVTYGILKSKSDGVYIVPVDENNNTYLVRQYRYPLKEESWEVPAGRVDEGDFLAAAKRELHEETSLTAEKFTMLSTIHPANGVAAFNQEIYLAEDLMTTSDALDQVDGIIECKKLPLEDVVLMIMNNEITCPQTIAAIFMTREFLQRRST